MGFLLPIQLQSIFVLLTKEVKNRGKKYLLLKNLVWQYFSPKVVYDWVSKLDLLPSLLEEETANRDSVLVSPLP